MSVNELFNQAIQRVVYMPRNRQRVRSRPKTRIECCQRDVGRYRTHTRFSLGCKYH